MTQPQLFVWLLMTALLCISGTREIVRRNFALGATLFAIPLCGWLSMWASR